MVVGAGVLFVGLVLLYKLGRAEMKNKALTKAAEKVKLATTSTEG